MPPTRDRRGRVLHWDDVYVQFSDAAERMPLEDVDRELAASGYDLDKVRGAIGRLGRHAGIHSAYGAAVASRDARLGECLPFVPATELRAIEQTRRTPRRYRAERWSGKWAVAAGAAFAVLFVLPISGTVVARWFGPQVQHAEANLAAAADARGSYAGSADKIEEGYRAKIAARKKCSVDRGLCGEGKLASAGNEQSPLPGHKDGTAKGVAGKAKAAGDIKQA